MQKHLIHSSAGTRIFFLLLMSFVGSLIAGAVLLIMESTLPGFTANTVLYYRISILLQDIFMLFLPAYWVFMWITDKPMQLLGVKKSEKLSKGFLYGLLIFIASYPAITVIAQWNEQIVLPDSLQAMENWMRQLENAAKRITDLLLSGKSISDLLLNLLIIAAAAAFVEELFFRGALQQFLEKWLGNGHLAVWIGALIFSVIHLQFYGFFPRLFMGAVLGYLFLYTRNLWVPMLYHFVNNALVVTITYFFGESNFLEQLGDKPLSWESLPVIIASGLLTFFLFARLRRRLTDNRSGELINNV